jgi:hypothetical protein
MMKDPTPTPAMRRAVIVARLTQPGATTRGPVIVINLNDPRQVGDGHWLTQKAKA